MKALFLTVILMAFASCGNAQVKTKTEKEMKQEIAKLEEDCYKKCGYFLYSISKMYINNLTY